MCVPNLVSYLALDWFCVFIFPLNLLITCSLYAATCGYIMTILSNNFVTALQIFAFSKPVYTFKQNTPDRRLRYDIN